ncbi:MAG TPA: GntR family transcriptional regulator [Candidatus Avibacteroides avistercoris]|uniref:GntR family transcriptional regulator n=1 Tax=Candidatus Avibacteroides avistercoris TaxID=2840690 RepID=A0A9D2UJF5_9BACT|nr:GntR family transcriptional regulator [Candidatus Avibacteroides avistercoris]
MHIILGDYNNLEIVKRVSFGLYLDGDEDGEILLPARYVPDGYDIGDIIKVFVYLDNEERLVATTEEPLAKVGDFALLRVAWTNDYGAFLDWGLLKDLFVPFSEQEGKMVKGNSYLVYVTIDRKSYRIYASARLDKFLSRTKPPYETDEEVDIIVWRRTDLGWKVIVNGNHSGLVFANEVFRDLKTGDRLKGYVKRVRTDGKIDIALQRHGVAGDDDSSMRLLSAIEAQRGFLPLNDNSSPDEIYSMLGMSKKAFKRAAGKLYKQRLIIIDDDGLRLAARRPDKQIKIKER